MRKASRLLFLVFCVSAASALPGHAETTSYPEKDPLFSVEVPSGWQIERGNGAVKLIAQANAVCLLQHVDNVKNEETAQAALPQLTELEGRQFDLNNLIISGKPKNLKFGDFNCFMTFGRGIDKGGNETHWQVMLFAPKEGDYYLVTCLWTKNDEEKTGPDRASIFNSLKSLNSAYIYR